MSDLVPVNNKPPAKRGYGGGSSIAARAGGYGPDLADKLGRVPAWAHDIEKDPVKLAAWFHDVTVSQDRDLKAVIKLPHEAHIGWVISNYGEGVKRAVNKLIPNNTGISYTAEEWASTGSSEYVNEIIKAAQQRNEPPTQEVVK